MPYAVVTRRQLGYLAPTGPPLKGRVMARKSHYTKDEFNKLCLSMGYDPKLVASIRINPSGMYVTFYNTDASNGHPPILTHAHEIR